VKLVEVLEEIAQKSDITVGVFSGGREEHQYRKIQNFIHVFDKDSYSYSENERTGFAKIMEEYKDDTLYLVMIYCKSSINAKQSHGMLRQSG